MDTILGHDESKKLASFDIENTFVGVQTNVEMETSKKNISHMIEMKVPLLGMSRKVIEIGLHNMFDIMKNIRHGVLKCSTHIF